MKLKQAVHDRFEMIRREEAKMMRKEKERGVSGREGELQSSFWRRGDGGYEAEEIDGGEVEQIDRHSQDHQHHHRASLDSRPR